MNIHVCSTSYFYISWFCSLCFINRRSDFCFWGVIGFYRYLICIMHIFEFVVVVGVLLGCFFFLFLGSNSFLFCFILLWNYRFHHRWFRSIVHSLRCFQFRSACDNDWCVCSAQIFLIDGHFTRNFYWPSFWIYFSFRLWCV